MIPSQTSSFVFSSLMLLSLILFLCILIPSSSLTVLSPDTIVASKFSMVARRDFMGQFITYSSLMLVDPLPALSEDKSTIEQQQKQQRQLVQEAFSSIRDDLTLSTGLVPTLQRLIDEERYTEILQYTKESDAYFRKGKLGKARKLLTDPHWKGEAISMSNAVTFDLIGINRASRAGKENKEEQLRYLDNLKTDILNFLNLESTIVVVI